MRCGPAATGSFDGARNTCPSTVTVPLTPITSVPAPVRLSAIWSSAATVGSFGSRRAAAGAGTAAEGAVPGAGTAAEGAVPGAGTAAEGAIPVGGAATEGGAPAAGAAGEGAGAAS